MPGVIESDPMRLRQILINVVGNAIKFTSRGGVTVTVGGDGRHLSLKVQDTGRDRKSTRLNSSHLGISYAVFCLKKKKNKKNSTETRQQNNNAKPSQDTP